MLTKTESEADCESGSEVRTFEVIFITPISCSGPGAIKIKQAFRVKLNK